jgi:hypothetical protein
MERKWGLVVAGLAVAAVAGCSANGTHAPGSPQVHSKPVVAVQQAAPRVEQARLVTPSGPAAFRSWWVRGGYRQYQHVANDLSRLIITDTLQDNDDSFNADAQRLVADATLASRHLPPVDGAGYRAGMTELAQAGRDNLAGSYDKAYRDVQAALPKLAAFNKAISAWNTTAPATSSAS